MIYDLLINRLKCIAIFCLGIFWATNIVAQLNTDSLSVLLYKTEADTTSVNAGIALGRHYASIDADSAVYFFSLADSKAREIDYPYGQYKSYLYWGVVESTKLGNSDKALVLLDKALAMVEQYSYSDFDKLQTLRNKGVAQYYGGAIGSAIESYIEANDIAITNNFTEERTRILNNLGVFYRALKRFDEGINILHQSLELKRSLNDTVGMANTYFNLSSTYGKIDDYDNALKYVNIATQMFTELEMDLDVEECSLAKGVILGDLGKFKESIEVLQKFGDSDLQRFQIDKRHTAMIYLGKGHNKLGDHRKALIYLSKIEDEIIETDRIGHKVDFYEERSKALFGLGQFRKAYVDMDSLYKDFKKLEELESAELREEMETKYLTQEKESQIALLNTQNDLVEVQLKSAKTRNIALGVGLGLLGLVSLVLYSMYAKIQKQNKVIEKANSDKTILLKEIHHRVKNNLQVISSLLGLQSRYIEDDTALKAIQTGRLRVQTMSLLHQKLYSNSDLKSIKIKPYFQDLGENLFNTYNIQEDKISIEMDIDDIEMDVDDVVPLGLIVNELISNALKYAFEKQENGIIRLEIKKSNGNIKMKVSDNGPGYPFDKFPKKSTSLGIQLIKSFVEKLKADLIINNKAGAETIISFPLKKTAA